MKKVLIAVLCLLILIGSAAAETVYVLCQPDSFVYVRQFPKRGAAEAGYAELGDALETDGVKRNGFLLVYGFEGDAWIHTGFVTDSPVTVETVEGWVECGGRVACRRSIKGTRRKWLTDGAEVVIYAYSDEWSITNRGFIKTQYLGGF
jgi:hypothetical protein